MGYPAINFAKLGYGFDTNTRLLVHADGANGSSSFVDSSTSGHGFTLTGTPTISTAQSKFGGSSILMGGTDAIAVTGSLTDFAFGTGDFTVDAWVKTSVATVDGGLLRCIFTTDQLLVNNGALSFPIDTAGRVNPYCLIAGAATSLFVGAVNVADGNWHHVAITQASGTMRLFVDGVADGSVAFSTSVVGGNPIIGAGTTTKGRWNGHIEEMHVIKGQALWTAAFTPPAIPYS